MAILIILALVLAGVVIGGAGMRRVGRLAKRITGPWRPGAAGVALICFLGAGALVVRGAEIEGAILAVIGLVFAFLARRRSRGGREEAAAQRPASGMSRTEASRILGVAAEADRTAIDAAYRRLMQRAHPDLGGTNGLAAQLNAAREVLIGQS